MEAKQFNISNHRLQSKDFLKLIDEAFMFFNQTPLCTLPPMQSFTGSGVYALYYSGDFQPYLEIAKTNKLNAGSRAVYVGKAVPRGWRQGRTVADEEGEELHSRLREHAKSIKHTPSLKLGDFTCRFMVMEGAQSDLIGTVEAALIRRYMPLWNSVVDGFGNHDPGKGRYEQARSEWDVLHKGRPWAERLRGVSPETKDILEKF